MTLLVGLFRLCARYVAAPVAALAVAATVFLSPDLFYRLQYLRPHVLARPLFVLVLWFRPQGLMGKA